MANVEAVKTQEQTFPGSGWRKRRPRKGCKRLTSRERDTSATTKWKIRGFEYNEAGTKPKQVHFYGGSGPATLKGLDIQSDQYWSIGLNVPTRNPKSRSRDIRKVASGQSPKELQESSSSAKCSHQELAPRAILKEFSNPQISAERRRQLVIEAEFLDWHDQESNELLPVLERFIRENRDSNMGDDFVAVGSGIRTYVAHCPLNRIAALVEFLEPGHRADIPLEIELEVAKMAYRKFEANPPRAPEPEPELAERLAELASLYLNPRLLPRDKNAAVAMNACQALAAMWSPKAQAVFEQVASSRFDWFRQQLVRRLGRLSQRWEVQNVPAVEEVKKLTKILTG